MYKLKNLCYNLRIYEYWKPAVEYFRFFCRGFVLKQGKGDFQKMNKRKWKYMLLFLAAIGSILTGCSKAKETTISDYQVSEEDLNYALPKIGEASIIKAKVQPGSKGTISVATVGSPNTEILQEAARILGEKGYLLNIEICDDYLKPNQLITEGKVDCNYYQHAAFLERYNIEKGTSLLEMAKIHYEPMAVFSRKLSSLEEVEKGAKVAVSDNPTALAQSLWLLHDEGLLTLMSDADMTAMTDDIAKNPLQLEFVYMKEKEILKSLEEADLGLCHMGYALKEGIEAESILLAAEDRESKGARNLAQSVVVSQYPNENAGLLIDILMSEKMQKFIETEYQGSIYMMDGRISDIKVTTEVQSEKEDEETSAELQTEDGNEILEEDAENN